MASRRKWVWLGRLVCAGISAIILWRVFHLVHPTAIAGAFKTMRPGWFIASLILYGIVFVPAALRWHMVLRLAEAANRPIVTFQYTLIGHFFYMFFFGALGGDSAKAALYARRFNIPFPRLLATAPVDRFLGTGSTVLFAVVILLAGIPHLDWRIPWKWIVVSALGTVILLAVIRPLRFEPCRHFVHSFRRIIRLALSRGDVVAIGISCGLFAQLALSAVLALNLLAVSSEPVPLIRMLWTFPVVLAISSLPISIGGLGTREAAAVWLFGLYGVSSANATTASLLTFTASLVWAAIGAALIPIRSTQSENAAPSAAATATN